MRRLAPKSEAEWYEELLRDLRERYPQVNLHAFSPPELWHFHKLTRCPCAKCSAGSRRRARQPAGARRDPGGPGPQGDDREQVLTDEWLEVHRVWHDWAVVRPAP